MKIILELPARILPKIGIFQEQYRNAPYILSEYHDDFIYYEQTKINDIVFDDKYSLPWGFFSIEGLDYFLPRILYLIQKDIDNLSVSLHDFIVNMSMDIHLRILVERLDGDELAILGQIFEQILFESSEDVVSAIGEYYLWLDLAFIDSLKMK